MTSRKGSLAEQLALSPPPERAKFLQSLSDDEARALQFDWLRFWARPQQLAPSDALWRYWLILAGRGFGKSRVGAQWVIEQVRDHGARRVALVAETAADARDVMVEGESGILACSPPWFYPVYQPTKRRLTWPNGAIARTYTAEKPAQLRGPQHDAAWADEVAKWRFAQQTWDQLMFGLRLGNNPRVVATTTPRPIPLIKALVKDDLCRVTRGTTYDNKANLAAPFLTAILKRFEGTRLGRQELNAEILDDAPGALWNREHIEQKLRVSKIPKLTRIVIAVDPNVKSGEPEDDAGEAQDGVSKAELGECGIVAAGLGEDGIGYLLGDYSLVQPTPDAWGRETVVAYHKHQADRVIAEVNNGGDLVEANVRAVEQRIPFKQVRASRGKAIRAEPISALGEQCRIKHFGCFPLLEDQLCQWEPGISTWSPNRLDAYVWAFSELMLKPHDPGGWTLATSTPKNR